MSQNQLIMSNFSNLEKRLQEKDQLLDEKESQIQEKDLQISLLNSKIQEIDQKWMPHSEFLLSNMESEDLLTYDELYSKFVELHVEKSELEEFKEVSINALMEKDSLITDLNNKILEIENKSIMYENTQFEILQDRENTRERLMCLSDKIKKEEIEQLEKKKNIETEINKEVQQKIDEHLKKSKERENELHNALNKCGEEIENLKHQLESQEKRFFIKEKVYKKDLENYSNKVDALEIKTAVDPEDVMKLNNKFTKDIEGLKREIVENKEAHSLEIQKIESEKIKFIKRVESSQSDNKKIEEIKQYLQKEIESLQRDLLLKDEIIDELKSDFKNQMIEMKEKQELEMKALEIQNKKLKQDDEIFRRKSSIIMKPLINELSSMANSNKFNFFDKLTKEISSDEEDEQQEEIERLEEELLEAINQITEVKQENQILKKDADEILSEKKQLIEKNEKIQENIETLTKKFNELEEIKHLISTENDDMKEIILKLQLELTQYKDIIENLKKEIAFKEALHREACHLLKDSSEFWDLRKDSLEFCDEMKETIEKVEKILEKTNEIEISSEKIDDFFNDLQQENSKMKEIIGLHEGNLLDLKQEIEELKQKGFFNNEELTHFATKIEEIILPIPINDEINLKIKKLYQERSGLKKEIQKSVIKFNAKELKEKELNIEIESHIKEKEVLNDKNNDLSNEIEVVKKEIENLKAFEVENSSLLDLIAQLKLKIIELENQINELIKENYDLKESFKNNDDTYIKDIDDLKQRINELIKETNDQTNQIALKNDEISTKIKENVSFIEKIDILKEELLKNQEELLISKELIEISKNELLEKTNVIEEKNKVLETLDFEIKSKNEEIIITKQKLEENTKEITVITNDLLQKKQEIYDLTTETTIQKQEILEITNELLIKQKEIEQENLTIDEMKQQIEFFKEQINTDKEQIETHKQEIQETLKEIDSQKQEKAIFIQENQSLKEEKALLEKEEETLKKENNELEQEKEDMKESLQNQITTLIKSLQEMEQSNIKLQEANTQNLQEISFMESILNELQELLLKQKNLTSQANFNEILTEIEIPDIEKKLIQSSFLMEQANETINSIGHIISTKKTNPNISNIQNLHHENLHYKETLTSHNNFLQSLIKTLETDNSNPDILNVLKTAQSQLEAPIHQESLEKWVVLSNLRSKLHEIETMKGLKSQENQDLTSKIANLENNLAYKDSFTSQALTTLTQLLPKDEIPLIQAALIASQSLLEKALENQSPAYLLSKWNEIQEENKQMKQGISIIGLKSQGLMENLRRFSLDYLQKADLNDIEKKAFEELQKEAENLPINTLETGGFLKKMREMQKEKNDMKAEMLIMSEKLKVLSSDNQNLQGINEEITNFTDNIQRTIISIEDELQKTQTQNKESLCELNSLKKLIVFYENKLEETLGEIPIFTQKELRHGHETQSATLKKVREVQTQQASKGVLIKQDIEKLNALKEKTKEICKKSFSTPNLIKELQLENEALKLDNLKAKAFQKNLNEKLEEFLKKGENKELIEELKNNIEKYQFIDSNPQADLLLENYLLKVESFSNNRLKEEVLQLIEEIESGVKSNSSEALISNLGLLSTVKECLKNPLEVSESDLEMNFMKIREKLQQKEAEFHNFSLQIEPFFKELFNLELPLDIHLQKAIDLKRSLNKFFQKDSETGIIITGELKDLVSRQSLLASEEKLRYFEYKIKESNEKISQLELQIELAIKALQEQDPSIKEEMLQELQAALKKANEELQKTKSLLQGANEGFVPLDNLIESEKKMRFFEQKLHNSEEKIKELEKTIRESIEALSRSELDPILKEEALKKMELSYGVLLDNFKEEINSMKTIMNQFKKELDDKNTELDGLKGEKKRFLKEIEELKNQGTRDKQEIEGYKNKINQYNRKKEFQNSEIMELNQKLNEDFLLIKQLNKEIQDLDQKSIKKSTLIEDLKTKNKEILIKINEKEDNLKGFLQEIVEKNLEIKALQGIIEEKSTETHNLDIELKEKAQEIKNTSEDLNAKSKEISVLKEIILVEKSNEIKALKDLIHDIKEEIQEKTEILKEKLKENLTLNEKIDMKTKEIEVLNQKNDEIDTHNKEIQKENLEIKIQNMQLQKEIDLILKSDLNKIIEEMKLKIITDEILIETLKADFNQQKEALNLEKTAQINITLTKIQELTVQLKENEEKLKNTSFLNKELQEEILTKFTQIKDLQLESKLNSDEISRKTTQISQLQAQALDTDYEIHDKTTKLAQKDIYIAELQKQQEYSKAFHTKDLDNLHKELLEKTEAYDSLKIVLFSKETALKEAINRLEQYNIEKAHEVNELRIEILEKAGLLDAIKKVLLEKESNLQDLHYKLKEMDKNERIIEQMKKTLFEKELLIDEYKQMIYLKENDIKNLKEQKELVIEALKTEKQALENDFLLKEANLIKQMNKDFNLSQQIKSNEINALKQMLIQKENSIQELSEKLRHHINLYNISLSKEEELSSLLKGKDLENEELRQKILIKEENLRKIMEKNQRLEILINEISSKDEEIIRKNKEIDNMKEIISQKVQINMDLTENLKNLEAKLLSKNHAFLLLDSQLKLALETLMNQDYNKEASEKALRSLKDSYDNLNLLLQDSATLSEEMKIMDAKTKQITIAFHEFYLLNNTMSSTKRQRNKALDYVAFLLPFTQDFKTIIERKRTSGHIFEGYGPKKVKKIKHLTRSDSEEIKGNPPCFENLKNQKDLLKNYQTIRKQIENTQKSNLECCEIIFSEDSTQSQQFKALHQLQTTFTTTSLTTNLLLNEKLLSNLISNNQSLLTSYQSQNHSHLSLQLSQNSLKKLNKTLEKKVSKLLIKIKDLEIKFNLITENLQNTINSLFSSDLSLKEREALLQSLQSQFSNLKSLVSGFEASEQKHRVFEELSLKEKESLQLELNKYMRVIEDIQSEYEFTKQALENTHKRLQESLLLLQDKSLTEEEREIALKRLHSCDDELSRARRRLVEMEDQKKKTMRGLQDLQGELESVMNKGKDYQELLREKGVECEELKKNCELLRKENEKFDRELEIIRSLESLSKKNESRICDVIEEMIRKLERNQDSNLEKMMKEIANWKKIEEIELQEKIRNFKEKISMNENTLMICQKELEKLDEELMQNKINNQEVKLNLSKRLNSCIKQFIDLQIENKLIKSALNDTCAFLEKFKLKMSQEFEDFIKKKEQSSKTEFIDFRNDFLDILGEFSGVFDEMQESYKQRTKEIKEIEYLKTESTTIMKPLKTLNNNLRTTIYESETIAPLSTIHNQNVLTEEDFIADMNWNHWEETSNQLSIIKDAYEALKLNLAEKDKSNSFLKNENKRINDFTSEVYKKLKTFSKKIKKLVNFNFQTSTIVKSTIFKDKSLNFSNELQDLSSELKSHILEIIDNANLLEKDLEQSLKLATMSSRERIKNPKYIDESYNILDKRSFQNINYLIESPDELIDDYSINEKKSEEQELKSSYKYSTIQSKKTRLIHKSTAGIRFNDKIKLLREKSMVRAKNLTAFSLPGEEITPQNKRSEIFESDSLKKENDRLSFDIKTLENNYQENSLWAKTLNQNCRDLKEDILKYENFQSSLCPILSSSTEPQFFDIFSLFSSEQQSIIVKLKGLMISNKTLIIDQTPLKKENSPFKNSFIDNKKKKIYQMDQGIQKNDETIEKLIKANKDLIKQLTDKERELKHNILYFDLEKQKLEKNFKENELKTNVFYQKLQQRQKGSKDLSKLQFSKEPTTNLKENLIKKLNENIEEKEKEVSKWKERYMNLEKKFHEMFKVFEEKTHFSERNSLETQGNNVFINQNKEQIDFLSKKLLIQEQNTRLSKLKSIQERAALQKTIKDLKDQIIEKNTLGILNDMNQEF